MATKPYGFRISKEDEKNLEMIMEVEGIKTKSKAIKKALRLAANVLRGRSAKL